MGGQKTMFFRSRALTKQYRLGPSISDYSSISQTRGLLSQHVSFLIFLCLWPCRCAYTGTSSVMAPSPERGLCPRAFAGLSHSSLSDTGCKVSSAHRSETDSEHGLHIRLMEKMRNLQIFQKQGFYSESAGTNLQLEQG